MKTNAAKLRLLHQMRGSRQLEDNLAEQVAYILSDPQVRDDLHQFIEIAPERVEELKKDLLFQRRVDFLAKKHKPKKPLQSMQEYREFALRRLHKLALTAKNAKDQVSACRALGDITKAAGDAIPVERPIPAPPDPAFEELQRTMEESND